MLIQFVKKTIVKLFTDNPYKVRSFNTVFKAKVGIPVDIPESLSIILIREAGELTTYYNPSSFSGEDLRYRYKENLKRFISSGIFKTPDRLLYSISGAGILGQVGLVYDPASRSFINESANDWVQNISSSPYTNAYQLPPVVDLKGLTFSFLSLGAEAGFYHFLFESLTKTAMFTPLIKQANHLLFNGPPIAWKQKWLERAGVDISQIIWVSNSGHYRCQQLLFTGRLVADQQISKWAVNTLKDLFKVTSGKTKAPPQKKVLWLSRKGQYQRAIEWEDSILYLMPEIERIDLSEMSAEETIVIMQSATHVTGPHGAAFSNLYLCAPGTKVLEIFPAGTFIQPCYSRLSSVCDLSHDILYLDFQNEKSKSHGITLLMKHLISFLCRT